MSNSFDDLVLASALLFCTVSFLLAKGVSRSFPLCIFSDLALHFFRVEKSQGHLLFELQRLHRGLIGNVDAWRWEDVKEDAVGKEAKLVVLHMEGDTVGLAGLMIDCGHSVQNQKSCKTVDTQPFAILNRNCDEVVGVVILGL